MVDFCPKCGSILYPKKKDNKKLLFCKMCEFEKEPETKAATADFAMPIKIDHSMDKTLIKNEKYYQDVYGSKTSDKSMDCPRCGAKMVMAVRQTRRADEGPTIFYTCTRCNKQVRIGS
nr:transcription factor S [Candidatus Sigynarchaeota archaeon]